MLISYMMIQFSILPIKVWGNNIEATGNIVRMKAENRGNLRVVVPFYFRVANNCVLIVF